MDANEQAPVETTTQTEVSQPEAAGSEAAQTPDHSGEKGPDFKQAMYEERDKRKGLEQSLNDANFVYEQARRLGLTGDEPDEAPAPAASPGVRQPTPSLPSLVQFELEKAKALEKYPELASDEQLGVMATALMNQGMSPLKAAETIFTRMGKLKEATSAEESAKAEAQVTAKERSQTVAGGNQVTESVGELDQLRKTIRSSQDKTSRDKAMVELLKIRNKQSGVA